MQTEASAPSRACSASNAGVAARQPRSASRRSIKKKPGGVTKPGFEGNHSTDAASHGNGMPRTMFINSVGSGPFEGFFFWRNWMPKWRSEYRRCDNCRSEYRPKREAQSYCSRDCRRAAAYRRERFKAGTVGRRERRVEASDKLKLPKGGFFFNRNRILQTDRLDRRTQSSSRP